MKKIKNKNMRIVDDMKNCFQSLGLPVYKDPHKKNKYSFCSEFQVNNLRADILALYDHKHKYATITVDFSKLVPSHKMSVSLELINLINCYLSIFHFIVCEKCGSVSLRSGLFVPGKHLSKRKFKMIVNSLLESAKLVLPVFVELLSTDGQTKELVSKLWSENPDLLKSENKNNINFEAILQDVEDIFTNLGMMVQNDYLEDGYIMADFQLQHHGNRIFRIWTQFGNDFDFIILYMSIEQVAAVDKIAPVTELINFINKSTVIDHVVLIPETRRVCLKTGIILDKGSIPKEEFNRAVRTLFGNGSTFFSLILEHFSSNKSPQEIMDKYWKNNPPEVATCHSD